MIFFIFLATWILIMLFLGITVLKGFPAMVAVGPIPAHKKGIAKALELAEIKPDERFYDLGCGDGRVLVEAVKKYDCLGVGYDLVLPYYLLTKARALLSGKSEKIEVRLENIFKADIENADIIFCFLTPSLMVKIGKMLGKTRLKKGVRVISYAFGIKDLEPTAKIGHSKDNWNIYLYKL
ncbi:MAG: hypothetical protein WA063_06425 [Minisyncoccia bacterium]